jgi:hypothetical protein
MYECRLVEMWKRITTHGAEVVRQQSYCLIVHIINCVQHSVEMTHVILLGVFYTGSHHAATVSKSTSAVLRHLRYDKGISNVPHFLAATGYYLYSSI